MISLDPSHALPSFSLEFHTDGVAGSDTSTNGGAVVGTSMGGITVGDMGMNGGAVNDTSMNGSAVDDTGTNGGAVNDTSMNGSAVRAQMGVPWLFQAQMEVVVKPG